MRSFSQVFFVASIVLMQSSTIYAAPINVEVILPDLELDAEGDKNVFAVPFDYRDGQVFTVHVEPSLGNGVEGINLRTVVRHGIRQSDGQWNWTSRSIEERTIRDPWHAQASISLDKLGYVHVAYNMHNMPWQYSVSQKPMDIGNFVFRGQSVSLDEIKEVKFKNRTPFPHIGSASISGNQITYPMFFVDQVGELYLLYRYATRPARSWEERGFAGGLSKYDAVSRTWRSIGAPIKFSFGDALIPAGLPSVQQAIAFEDTYSVYLMTLAFDANSGMHAVWNWRPGGAGEDTIVPSYAYSPDGERFFKANGSEYQLPIKLADADAIDSGDQAKKYYAPKSISVLPDGRPLIVIHSIKEGRLLVTWNATSKKWTTPEPTPSGASEIVVDKHGRIWAFATGLKVYMRESMEHPWQDVGQIKKNLCFPKVKYIPQEQKFVVHAKRCDGRMASIVSFRR